MIKVEQLKSANGLQLQQLIKRSRYKPYRSFPGVQEEDVVSLLQKEISAIENDHQLSAFVAKEGDNIIGFSLISELPWDSGIFGVRMSAIKHMYLDSESGNCSNAASALIEESVNWCRAEKYEFILRKINTDDIPCLHALEKNKFLLVDTLLDYAYDPYKKPFTNLIPPVMVAGGSTRLATLEDESELMSIASRSFDKHFGRFHSDPNIDHDLANKVYIEWIKSSLRGYADFVVLLEVEGRIAAYSIWKYPTSDEVEHNIPVGHYSLGAVHPDFFGMGLFYAITYEGMRRMVTRTKCVEGPTHINNYPVQRGYTKLGWQIYDAHYAFHRWL